MQHDPTISPDHDTVAVHRSRTSSAPRPGDTSSPWAPAATRSPRRKRFGLFAGAIVALLFATGCNVPIAEWVPDFNADGTIDDSEVARQREVLIAQFVAAVEAHRHGIQAHPFLTCVRHHESDRDGGYPYDNGYGAKNPSSSASGAYQFLDSTWRTVSAKAGHAGYSSARYAPWHVQDDVALWLYRNGGRSAWNGTGC